MSQGKIVVNKPPVPRVLKGITPQQIQANRAFVAEQNKKILNRKGGRKLTPPKSVQGTGTAAPTKPAIHRPAKLLTTIKSKITRIPMPEAGSFNPGIEKIPNSDKYICVYRPSEFKFIACVLDKNLQITTDSFFKFSLTNCADPRLIWSGNKLLMIYSSTDEGKLHLECIRGCVIMDLDKGLKFIDAKPHRISPPELHIRQKNWMPFVYEDKIFLIASVCPHVIYELNTDTFQAEKKFETSWLNPWMFKEFLRGNTQAVRLDDGNYLGTFHSAVWSEGKCYYDNGSYLFEGKPPFRVLKCSNKTYLPAEAAVEPHFRNARTIVCTFPVGMVREGDKLLISYGDNDSIVKVMETSVKDMVDSMLEIY